MPFVIPGKCGERMKKKTPLTARFRIFVRAITAIGFMVTKPSSQYASTVFAFKFIGITWLICKMGNLKHSLKQHFKLKITSFWTAKRKTTNNHNN